MTDRYSFNTNETMQMKTLLKRLANQTIFISRPTTPRAMDLTGPYKSYEDASLHCSGYNHPAILEKVNESIIKLLTGLGTYERDGTLFPNRPSVDNIRSILSAHLNVNDLVVDFGGGLGGTFINNRDLFRDKQYVVIEQNNFVRVGRTLASRFQLHIEFLNDLSDLPANPNMIIFSSVLQYIPNFSQVLRDAAQLGPRLILIDRTAFAHKRSSNDWWIQNEPFYYRIPISYPNRPVSLDCILSTLKQYSVVTKWKNSFDPDIPPHGGLLLRRCV